MLSNARLILTLMENGGCQDRMGWGRRISTHRCEQSNQSERSQFLCSSEKYIILFEEHCPVGCRAKEIFKETVKDDHVLTLKTPMICSRIEVPVTLKEQLKFLIFFYVMDFAIKTDLKNYACSKTWSAPFTWRSQLVQSESCFFEFILYFCYRQR